MDGEQMVNGQRMDTKQRTQANERYLNSPWKVHEILKMEEQRVHAHQTTEPRRTVDRQSNRRVLLFSVIVKNCWRHWQSTYLALALVEYQNYDNI